MTEKEFGNLLRRFKKRVDVPKGIKFIYSNDYPYSLFGTMDGPRACFHPLFNEIWLKKSSNYSEFRVIASLCHEVAHARVENRLKPEDSHHCSMWRRETSKLIKQATGLHCPEKLIGATTYHFNEKQLVLLDRRKNNPKKIRPHDVYTPF